MVASLDEDLVWDEQTPRFPEASRGAPVLEQEEPKCGVPGEGDWQKGVQHPRQVDHEWW